MNQDLFDLFSTTKLLAEADEALQLASDMSGDVGELQFRVKTLAGVVKAQRETLTRVELVVNALTDLLVANGTLERGQLVDGVQKEIAARNAERAAQKAAAHGKHAEPRMVVCTQCKKSIPQTHSMMSERGPICSDCFQAQDAG